MRSCPGCVISSYAIEKHARIPNEPYDAEEDAANFEVELVDCSSFSVCFTHAHKLRSCMEEASGDDHNNES